MYKVFESARHKDSIVVIIGTMGNVVNVESFIEHDVMQKNIE